MEKKKPIYPKTWPLTEDRCDDCGEPTKDPDDRFCPPCQLQRDIERSELYLEK